jgi:glyoxylase-like metal-dependent hydrolase (beta-lactamase superfamily II)/rhodanese-related sulfurtransferase
MKSNLKSSKGKEVNPLEIDVAKVKEKLDKGEDVFILDVRTPEEHNAWKFSYDRYQETPVIPIDRLVSSENIVSEQIPKDKEILTVCSHGNRSQMAAQVLSKMGYKVKNIKGGMAAWNQVYDVAKLPGSNVITTATMATQGTEQAAVWQLRRVSKGCIGYVIAVGDAATVIDSTCDLDNSVLRLAEDNGLKITNVIDTHMHADHVSGLSTIAKRVGANAFISREEEYEPAIDLGLQVTQIKDNQKIPLGDNVSLIAIHTPGHTEGSMSFVLNLHKEEEEGQKTRSCIFTGDTLFVNALGRPDLQNKAREFADKLYDTYQSKILQYPDNSIILPAHFDTNSIAVKHNEPISETIGSIKRKVKLLSIPKNDFIDFMVSSVTPHPANYEKIIQINKELIPCNRINSGDLEEGPNSCGIRM